MIARRAWRPGSLRYHAEDMKTRIALAAAVLVLAAPDRAPADEVVLRNGSTLSGRAREVGPEVVLEVPGGTIRLARRDVVSIERAPAPEDLYAARAASTDLGDPGAVRALADHAQSLGLFDVARRLRSTADAIELERRVEATAPGDAAGFRAIARWARERGFGREVERWLYERALRADPSDPEAALALARLAEEERRASSRDDEVERARADLAAELAALRRTSEAAQAEAARLRAELEAERERVARERAAAERGASVYSGYPYAAPFVVIARRGPRSFAPPHVDKRRSGRVDCGPWPSPWTRPAVPPSGPAVPARPAAWPPSPFSPSSRR